MNVNESIARYAAPRYGAQSFDHIGLATLNVFQTITLEGWADTMNRAVDGTNRGARPAAPRRATS